MANELALIVGGSSDIGTALIARLLATSTANILAHHHGSGDRIVQHERVKKIEADLASPTSAASLAEEVVANHGTPDLLVYLPGAKLRYERFSKFDMEHFDRDFTIQVRSAVVLLQRLVPAMAKKPRAKIVFVLSSVTRGLPPKFMAMYTMVKHGQLGLVRALASEYAHSGLTVNAVSPSMVETRFLEQIPDIAKEMSGKAAPRGRNARPDDVVGSILFLLSQDSDFITGVELPVACGLVA